MAAIAAAQFANKVELARIPFGSDISLVREAISRDGGVVLTGMLTRDQVAAINSELDPFFGGTAEGNFGEGEVNYLRDFMGHRTKRVVHCVRHSKTYREHVVGSPVLAEYIEIMCPGKAGCHSLISSHGIEIFPGEQAQILHRDGETHLMMLDLFRAAGPDILVNTIVALMDITEEMGATRVIPGSHLWSDFSVAGNPDQTIPATMNAGDVLLFSGKLLHGGGANLTKNRSRRVISTGFAVPFFMGEEAWPFAIPLEEVRSYPKAVQRLLGFRSVSFKGEEPGFLWRVDAKALEEVLDL